MGRQARVEKPAGISGGGMFSTPKRAPRKAASEKPETERTIADVRALLEDTRRSLTTDVDVAAPKADFLTGPGSHIQPGTPFSYVVRTRYENLTQMRPSQTVVDNNRTTVSKFLDAMRNNISGKGTYDLVTGTIQAYHALSDALTALEKIATELNRLTELKLTPKTIDKRLSEWTQEHIETPLVELISRVDRYSQVRGEVSDDLVFAQRSLEGRLRLLQKGTSPFTSTANTATAKHQGFDVSSAAFAAAAA